MEFAVSILIIALLILFDLVVNPRICKKKIFNHINNIGGKVIDIERLTLKEYLFIVNYIMDGKSEKAIVQFNVFYKSTWK